MISTKDLQLMLQTLGYDLGPAGADGVLGVRTTAAIASFQRDAGVIVQIPGSFGAKTEAALLDAFQARQGRFTPPVGDLPWMNMAKSLIGVKEINGPRNSPVIMGWAEEMRQWFPNDETAWCGLYTGYCFFKALPDETRPKNILGARQWERFGVALVRPVYGSVVTFWRGSPQSGYGHVGFYIGEDDEAYHVLGGNTEDMVKDARIGKHRFTAARWPSSYDYPDMKSVIFRNKSGALSTNEA